MFLIIEFKLDLILILILILNQNNLTFEQQKVWLSGTRVYLCFFIRDQGGEMLYARGVGLALRT